MAQRKSGGAQGARNEPRSIWASVSPQPEIYRTLEVLARQNNVSIAWVLRDAAERDIAGQWLLLAAGDAGGEGQAT